MATACAKRLIQQRKISVCQVCGERPAQEAHHCLYGKKKGVKELDEDYNLQLVCVECHKFSGLAKSYENKLQFWNWACDYYGKAIMLDWHDRVPLKIKEYAYK